MRGNRGKKRRGDDERKVFAWTSGKEAHRMLRSGEKIMIQRPLNQRGIPPDDISLGLEPLGINRRR